MSGDFELALKTPTSDERTHAAATTGHTEELAPITNGQSPLKLPTPVSPAHAIQLAEQLPISSLPTPPSVSSPPTAPTNDTLPTLPPSPPLKTHDIEPPAIPPAPVVPLPLLNIPSHPVRADSNSSIAAQPPTPLPLPLLPTSAAASTPAADSSASAPQSAAGDDDEGEAEAAQIQSQLAAIIAEQENEQELAKKRLEEQEDVQMSGVADVGVVDSSEGSANSLKRSAPAAEEEVNGIVPVENGSKSEEDEREAKRQKIDDPVVTELPSLGTFAASTSSEFTPLPAATTTSAVPEPAGYDPSAFSIDGPSTSGAALTSLPTISPTDLQQSSPFGSPPPAPSTNMTAPPGLPTLPAPAPSSTSSTPLTGPIPVLTKPQLKHLQALIRSLKKHRSAPPFLRPVDPVALLIPDYLKVITRPMDLGTVETKLNNTSKAMNAAGKLGRTFGLDYSGVGNWEGMGEGVYRTAKEAREDVELVWENCFRYNGPKDKNPVSAMAGQLQDVAEKALKTLPIAPALEYKPEPPRLPTPEVVKKERRPSTSFVPTIRRSEDGPRPKREIHAPARELPYEESSRPSKVSGKFAQEQYRFCRETIKELFKKNHEAYAFPFYSPVDHVALNIPQYPQIVKRPMDLGTIRTKLESNLYSSPPYGPFEADVRLVFKNCYAFNPPGTTVHDWGKKLEGVFEEKWLTRPMEEEEEEDSGDENILLLEKQVQELQATLVMLRAKKMAKEQRKAAERAARPPKASTSSHNHHGGSNHHSKKKDPDRAKSSSSHRKRSSVSGAAGGGSKKKKGGSSKKHQYSDEEEEYYGGEVAAPTAPVQDETVTFEMKRDLAVKIVSFEGDNLEKAIDIIRKGRPDLLGDANKEIELDIDQLDQKTLLALYRFVCPAPAPVRRGGAPKGGNRRASTNAGPAKRKNLDETKEAQRIEMLEARLAQFDNSAAPTPATPAVEDQASSDSSSDDGSDSDSEDDD